MFVCKCDSSKKQKYFLRYKWRSNWSLVVLLKSIFKRLNITADLLSYLSFLWLASCDRCVCIVKSHVVQQLQSAALQSGLGTGPVELPRVYSVRICCATKTIIIKNKNTESPEYPEKHGAGWEREGLRKQNKEAKQRAERWLNGRRPTTMWTTCSCILPVLTHIPPTPTHPL